MRVAGRIASGVHLTLIALLWPAVVPAPAEAGAWTREPGSTQFITVIGKRGAPLRAGEDAGGTDTSTFQAYGEHGLTETVTLGGKFWLDMATGDPEIGSAAIGPFLRKRLWRTDTGHVAAVQVGALAPVEDWIGGEFGRSKPFSTYEAAVRALYGKSWWGDWGSAFVSTEGGYQYRLDLPDEIRADVTAGIEPVDCCMAMLGVYGLMPIEAGLTDRSLRFAPSLVWHAFGGDEETADGRATSLQLGLTYDALQPEDGLGFFLGIWQEF